MTPLRRVAQSTAAFLGSTLARGALGFALAVVIGRGLGADRFGQWVLCTTWASLLTVVADLGFGVLLTRDGARAGAPVDRLVAGALLARLSVAVPLAAALSAGAGWIVPDNGSTAALRVAALLGVVSAAYGCFSAVLISQPRWLPIVLGIDTAWLGIQLAASWWIAASGSGGSGGLVGFGSSGSGGAGGLVAFPSVGGEVVALLVVASLVQIAQIATALVLWRRVFPDHRARLSGRREGLRSLARRALPFAGAGIVANLDLRAAPVLLGALSTPAAVGLYAAASRFGRLAVLAPQALFGGALPVLSGEFQRDPAGTMRVFRTLDRALLAFSGSIAVACVALGPFLLRVAFGPSFVAAAPTLVWIGIGLIPSLTNAAREIALYAAGGEAAVVRWTGTALVVQVLSAAMLIPMLGSTGAAIGVFVGEAAVWLPLRRANAGASRAPGELPLFARP